MVSTEKLMGLISKSYGISILKVLKHGEKSFMDIVRTIKGDKSTIYRRLREFTELGIVLERYDHKDRCLKYSLTSTGKAILNAVELFEEHTKDLEVAIT